MSLATSTGNDTWTGPMPGQWARLRLGNCFRERNESTTAELLSPLSVTKAGVVDQQEQVAKSQLGAPKKVARAGDFVINSRSDRKGSAGLAPRDGSVSVINIVLEPREIYPRFAHHLLRSGAFQEEFFRWGSGIVDDLWSTRYAAMKNIVLPMPPASEQRAIADYLDHETAEIDTFIEDQQRMRALIEERWTSDLVHKIQTGMSHASELETTGVPTWPQAPRSWRRARLKSTVLNHQNGAWGTEPGEDAWTARCIRVADFDKKHARIHSANVTMRDYPVTAVHANGLHPGDLIIEKSGGGPTSPVGNVVLYDGRGGDMYSNFTARIQVADSADSLYAVYLHRSLYLTRVTSRSVKQSTGIQNLDMTSYLNEPVFLPEVGDQRRLATEIETSRRDLDAVTSDIDSSVVFARERRAALISAAVTGQIDVTQKRRPVAEQLEDEVKQLS